MQWKSFLTTELMLQLLLVDPQLSGKHWLIESWYNYYYIIKSCTLFFDSVDSLDIFKFDWSYANQAMAAEFQSLESFIFHLKLRKMCHARHCVLSLLGIQLWYIIGATPGVNFSSSAIRMIGQTIPMCSNIHSTRATIYNTLQLDFGRYGYLL